jgi:hypothetical protein
VSEIDGNTSDGSHTFKELYAHRRALTAALVATGKFYAWRSRAHHPDDTPCYEGYFIVGLQLPTGMITYHYELEYWDDFHFNTDDLIHAPKWDGEGPEDTIKHLISFARRIA